MGTNFFIAVGFLLLLGIFGIIAGVQWLLDKWRRR